VVTHRELEALARQVVGPKVVMCAVGDAVYRKLEDGTWEAYESTVGLERKLMTGES